MSDPAGQARPRAGDQPNRMLRFKPAAWLIHGNSVIAKAIRFGVVGAASAAVFSVAAVLLIRFAGVEEKTASLLAYLASMPLNFVGNRNFSFVSKGNVVSQAIKFCILHAIGMIVTASAMATAVNALGLHYGFGIVGAVVLVPMFNFIAMNLWVFRAERPERER